MQDAIVPCQNELTSLTMPKALYPLNGYWNSILKFSTRKWWYFNLPFNQLIANLTNRIYCIHALQQRVKN